MMENVDLVEKWVIRIREEKFVDKKKVKFNEEEIQCENMFEVCRVLVTYKPKRGYEITKIDISKELVLF